MIVLWWCYYAVVCSDMISKQLDQYSSVLHKSGSWCDNSFTAARLHCVLGNLIVQSLHHRDIAEREHMILLLS